MGTPEILRQVSLQLKCLLDSARVELVNVTMHRILDLLNVPEHFHPRFSQDADFIDVALLGLHLVLPHVDSCVVLKADVKLQYLLHGSTYRTFEQSPHLVMGLESPRRTLAGYISESVQQEVREALLLGLESTFATLERAFLAIHLQRWAQRFSVETVVQIISTTDDPMIFKVCCYDRHVALNDSTAGTL